MILANPFVVANSTFLWEISRLLSQTTPSGDPQSDLGVC